MMNLSWSVGPRSSKLLNIILSASPDEGHLISMLIVKSSTHANSSSDIAPLVSRTTRYPSLSSLTSNFGVSFCAIGSPPVRQTCLHFCFATFFMIWSRVISSPLSKAWGVSQYVHLSGDPEVLMNAVGAPIMSPSPWSDLKIEYTFIISPRTLADPPCQHPKTLEASGGRSRTFRRPSH